LEAGVTMKYLHVLASVNPSLGGPVEGVSQINRAMVKAGHEVHVASCDDPNADFVRSSQLEVIPLGPSRGTYSYTSRLAPWLREHAKQYEAVVINGLWQYHSFATYRALRHSGTPYVVFTHGMLDPWFKREYPLKHLKKWMYWPWAEYRVLKHARNVLFTSEEERLLARKSFWLYSCRERVVSYGTAGAPSEDLSDQRASFLERFPRLQDRRFILFLGRIHPKKGCDMLLEAFADAKRRDPALLLVMTGPDQVSWRPELERLAQSHGISNDVIWTGMLEGNAKWGAFAAAEAFILPSHQENFGIGVAEALSCGLPVLISDKVNIWREISGDRAGLVEADDREGTKSLLRRWIELSPQQRFQMKIAARNCFRNRFEIDRVTNSLLQVLLEAKDSNAFLPTLQLETAR
jgi:glycosyltransferase involved in cell wall biosynthesis